MIIFRSILFFFCLLIGIPSDFIQAEESRAVLPVTEAFQVDAFLYQHKIMVNFDVTPGYYLYKSRIAFASFSKKYHIKKINLPTGILKFDVFSKRQTIVYPNNTQITLTTTPNIDDSITLEIGFQGCGPGICYPPQRRVFILSAHAKETAKHTTKNLMDTPKDSALLKNGLPDILQQQTRAPQASIPVSLPQTSPKRVQVKSVAKLVASDHKAPSPQVPSAVTSKDQIMQEQVGGGRFAHLLAGDHLFLSLVFFLLAGIGLSFTPCVLPMIPIVSAIIVGSENAKKKKTFALTLSYVMAMALTYALIGTLVGLFGAQLNLQAKLQSPPILIVFSAVFVLLALNLFGVLPLRLPVSIGARYQNQNVKGGNYLGAVLLGVGSSLVVSPCVSAPLAGVLVYISSTENALLGAMALFALGFGMGTPLLVMGLGARHVLPKVGAWMNSVSTAFAIGLLAVAIWLLERVLPNTWIFLLWGLLLLCTGIRMGAFRPFAGAGWSTLWQGFGLALLTWGVFMLVGAASGHEDLLLPLKGRAPIPGYAFSPTVKKALFTTIKTPAELQRELGVAKELQQPMLLDFYADWCVSCKVMDRDVFSQSAIQSQLRKFHLVRLDITENTKDQQKILSNYHIFGPPSLVFFTPGGRWLKNLNLQGEVALDKFTQHLLRVLNFVK